MPVQSRGFLPLLLLVFLSGSAVIAQNNKGYLESLVNPDPSDENTAPGMFTQYSLFAVHARENGNSAGRAYGGRLEFYYGDAEDIPEGKNRAGFYGGTACIEAGYGGWIPYEFTVGAAGGAQFRNRIAWGFQYNMLGIYSYTGMAYGGSGIKLKARYGCFTLGWSRDGIGLVTGAFRNRDFSANHLEVKMNVYKGLGLGYKHTWLDRNNPELKQRENRIFVGMVF